MPESGGATVLPRVELLTTLLFHKRLWVKGGYMYGITMSRLEVIDWEIQKVWDRRADLLEQKRLVEAEIELADQQLDALRLERNELTSRLSQESS